MLMLEHKRVPYRRVEIVTLLHPLVARLHGFDAGGQRRAAGGRRTPGIRFGDRLGTVPGLAAGAQRISTNHGIARFLEQTHPEPSLFPTNPQRRAAVEKVETWANETLQMAARRILGAAVLRDPVAFSRSAANGRLGYLLYKRETTRRIVIPRILRQVFATSSKPERDPVADLPALLDRIDAEIEAGVLGAEDLNVADFMVAPSLALILYRPDVAPVFEGRPALELVERCLPEPPR
jgi:glutathione S-transferase